MKFTEIAVVISGMFATNVTFPEISPSGGAAACDGAERPTDVTSATAASLERRVHIDMAHTFGDGGRKSSRDPGMPMTTRTYVRANLGLIAVSAAWSSLVLVLRSGEKVPVHWNVLLEPDRYGSAAEFAVTLPAVQLFLFGLGWVPGIRGDDARASTAIMVVVALCTALHSLLSIRALF